MLSDLNADNYYARLDGEVLYLGYHNLAAKEDVCRIIDRRLDLISDFSDDIFLAGADLRYFNNAGYRDIKLSYKGRLLKVFITDNTKVNENKLISDCRMILYRSGLLESQ